MATTDAVALLDRLYDSFASGDASVWESSIADDAVLIGTDPNEYWTDGDEAKTAVRAQFDEMSDAGISLRRGEPIVRNLGDEVVLIVDRPTIVVPNGQDQLVRLSAVFIGAGDSLRLGHFHLSVPAGNEDVLGTTLTT